MSKRIHQALWRMLPIIGLTVLAAATSYAQDDVIQQRMKKDIFYLASPECEGRDVGTKGIDKAAEYIVNQITQAGLKPAGKDGTWFQPFTVQAKGGFGAKAESAGLDPVEAREVLASGKYTDEVRTAEETWRRAGITSVPSVIVNRKYLISGGQPAEVFEETLRKIAAET